MRLSSRAAVGGPVALALLGMLLVPVATSASGAPEVPESSPPEAGGAVELDESGLTPQQSDEVRTRTGRATTPRRWRTLLRASRDVRRTALLVVTLAVALAGCGAQHVQQRADDAARTDLPRNVAEAVGCLESRAPALWAGASDKGRLASELTECVGTTVLDQGDDAVRTADRLDMISGTVALTTDPSSGDLVIGLYTEGSGSAAVGVTQERVIVGTCWRVSVDASGELGAPAGAECSAAIVARANPTVVLPLDQVDVPSSTATEESS